METPPPENDPFQGAELADLEAINPEGVALDDYCVLSNVTYLLSAADLSARSGISRQEAIDTIRGLYPSTGSDEANAEFLKGMWLEHTPPPEDAELGWELLSVTAHGCAGTEVSEVMRNGMQQMLLRMGSHHFGAPPYDQDQDEEDE